MLIYIVWKKTTAKILGVFPSFPKIRATQVLGLVEPHVPSDAGATSLFCSLFLFSTWKHVGNVTSFLSGSLAQDISNFKLWRLNLWQKSLEKLTNPCEKFLHLVSFPLRCKKKVSKKVVKEDVVHDVLCHVTCFFRHSHSANPRFLCWSRRFFFLIEFARISQERAILDPKVRFSPLCFSECRSVMARPYPSTMLLGCKFPPNMRVVTVLATQRFVYFSPENLGNDPIWRAYFSNGLVQPPPRWKLVEILEVVVMPWGLLPQPAAGLAELWDRCS